MLPDFLDLSDRDQVMRALRKLIAKNLIMKVGQGVYVKAKESKLTGKVIPQIDLVEIGKAVAQKLNIKVVSVTGIVVINITAHRFFPFNPFNNLLACFKGFFSY